VNEIVFTIPKMMTSNHQHSYVGLTIATGIGGGGGGVDETETIELYTERTMDESAVIVENGVTIEGKSSIHSLLSSSCTTAASRRGSGDEVDNDDHDQHGGGDHNDDADDKNDDHHVRIDYATAIKQSKDSGVSTTTAHHDSSVDEISPTFHTVKHRASLYASSSSSTSSAEDSLEHDSGHSLARSESNRIRLWKVMVIVTIVAVAAVVSSGTFIFLGREEDDDYQHRVRWDTDFVLYGLFEMFAHGMVVGNCFVISLLFLRK
jgi:hypothetical protein